MAARRYSFVFYSAIIVALASTFGVYHVLEVTKANATIPTGPVLIAQQDIPEGAAVDRMSVVVVEWPRNTIPAGAFTSSDSVAGRVARVPVFKGEVLVPGRLAPDGTSPGLEVKIPPGKRAMPFRINDVSGIAGLIQPNSRVDILVVMNGGAEKGRVAKLFMENMRVLAIGSAAQRSEDGRPINAAVATVEVTPQEGEQLAIVTAEGQIQLMLRGYGDPDSVTTTGATTAQIVRRLNGGTTEQARADVQRTTTPRSRDNAPQSAPPPPIVVMPTPPKAKPDSNTITIIRGRQVEKQTFAVDSAKQDSLRKGRP